MHGCGLHFIIGQKGAAKTMLSCKLAWRVAAETQRIVVGNLPVKWEGLQDYFDGKWPGRGIVATERVWVLDDMFELKRFFLCRGFGWYVPDVPKAAWGKGQRPDFRFAYRWRETESDVAGRKHVLELTPQEIEAAVNMGDLERKRLEDLPAVQYVIDEVQNVFPSREWQDVGPFLLFYLTQQRKIGRVGDDILAMSQRPTLMDKQLREMADDWCFLSNWGKKQKSWFRLPSIVTWGKYDQLPGPGIHPLVKGTFQVDVKGIGQTYDTSAGVGIEGGLAADTTEKPSGIHWGWFIVMVALGFVLLWQVPGGLRGLFGWLVGSVTGGSVGVPQEEVIRPAVPHIDVQPVVVHVTNWVNGTPDASTVPEAAPARSDDVWLTGVRDLGRGAYWVYLSDGTQVHSDQVEGFELRRSAGSIHWIRMDGVEYRFRPPERNRSW